MNDKPKLVFLPGILCDQAAWQQVMAGLEDVADSQFVPVSGKTIEEMALSALDAAPAKFGLVGFSMGGYVALAMMRAAPERITRLCLVNTSAKADTEEQKKGRLNSIKMAKENGFSQIVEFLESATVHPDNTENETLRLAMRAMIYRNGEDVFQRQQSAVMTRIDSRHSLKEVSIPTQIITSDADRIVRPEDSHEMASLIPNAQIQILKRSGHMAPMEQPEEILRILRAWLQRF